jgi:hypothetical protein
MDPLPTDVLLEMIDTVLIFLATMDNALLMEGIMSASQKAAITSIHSCGKSRRSEIYQPISNLPFISKILDRIVFDQIKASLEELDLIPPFQSA